jgi:DNA-directed RNA polymerase subunit RPC12/RpoP
VKQKGDTPTECASRILVKGDVPTECASRILVKGDVPTECASRILVKGDTRCGGASPFYLICTKKKPLQISLHGSAPCANTQHARWHAYVKVRVPTDTCGPYA